MSPFNEHDDPRHLHDRQMHELDLFIGGATVGLKCRREYDSCELKLLEEVIHRVNHLKWGLSKRAYRQAEVFLSGSSSSYCRATLRSDSTNSSVIWLADSRR